MSVLRERRAVRAGPPTPAPHVVGHPDRAWRAGVRSRRERLHGERDLARPHVHAHVLVVVERRAAADLGRGLVEPEREHLRRLELLPGGGPDILPATWDELFAERLDGAKLLRFG